MASCTNKHVSIYRTGKYICATQLVPFTKSYDFALSNNHQASLADAKCVTVKYSFSFFFKAQWRFAEISRKFARIKCKNRARQIVFNSNYLLISGKNVVLYVLFSCLLKFCKFLFKRISYSAYSTKELHRVKKK